MKLFTLLSRRSTRELLQALLKEVHVGDSKWVDCGHICATSHRPFTDTNKSPKLNKVEQKMSTKNSDTSCKAYSFYLLSFKDPVKKYKCACYLVIVVCNQTK